MWLKIASTKPKTLETINKETCFQNLQKDKALQWHLWVL